MTGAADEVDGLESMSWNPRITEHGPGYDKERRGRLELGNEHPCAAISIYDGERHDFLTTRSLLDFLGLTTKKSDGRLASTALRRGYKIIRVPLSEWD